MLSEEKKQFVERTGIIIEKKGFTPIISRILALLLIAEPESMTFEEIRHLLNSSKSAISNAINFLLDKNYIRSYTRPGIRKRYFQLNIETWIEMLNSIGKQYESYGKILDQAIKLRSKEDNEFNEKLSSIRNLYKIFEEQLPILLKQWEINNATKRNRTQFSDEIIANDR